MRLLLIALLGVSLMAQGLQDQTQRTTPSINAVTPREFSGAGLPGAVPGNLSGDKYLRTGVSPAVEYFCGATPGTAAPACTSVAAGQWQAPASGAPTGSPYTGAVIYASHLPGVVLDCNSLTGLTASGGACTDNSTAINAVLGAASPSAPVYLMVDGGASITGIHASAAGGWTIDCGEWPHGFFIASGSNAHVISNGGSSGSPGSSVAIRNCVLNGNRGNGINGDSNSGNPRQDSGGNWLFGIYLGNMAHVQISHNWLYDEPSFAVFLNSCSDCTVEDNRFDAVSQALNQDGIHVGGPSNQIRISHNWCNTTDDCIAVNAAEGYGGTIDGVVADGNQCLGCLTAYRQLSNEFGGAVANAAVKHVVITNSSGSLATSGGFPAAAFRLGETNGGGTTPDIMQDVSISNVTYSGDATALFIDVKDNIGTLSVSNAHWLNPGGANPFLSFNNTANTAVTISNFVCTGCGIHRSTAGNAAAYLALLPNAATVTRMELNGFAVTNEQGQSYSALPYLMDIQSGGVIGTLVLDALDPALSPTLLNGNEWSRISRFYGPGISTYYRNTMFANLPPATFSGLDVSISDSSAVGVWGAVEAGGSAGHSAGLRSNGVSWTVTGK